MKKHWILSEIGLPGRTCRICTDTARSVLSKLIESCLLANPSEDATLALLPVEVPCSITNVSEEREEATLTPWAKSLCNTTWSETIKLVELCNTRGSENTARISFEATSDWRDYGGKRCAYTANLTASRHVFGDQPSRIIVSIHTPHPADKESWYPEMSSAAKWEEDSFGIGRLKETFLSIVKKLDLDRWVTVQDGAPGKLFVTVKGSGSRAVGTPWLDLGWPGGSGLSAPGPNSGSLFLTSFAINNLPPEYLSDFVSMISNSLFDGNSDPTADLVEFRTSFRELREFREWAGSLWGQVWLQKFCYSSARAPELRNIHDEVPVWTLQQIGDLKLARKKCSVYLLREVSGWRFLVAARGPLSRKRVNEIRAELAAIAGIPEDELWETMGPRGGWLGVPQW